MKLFRFRALLTLDAGREEEPNQYPSGTHALMIQSSRLGMPGARRNFPAAIYRVDEQPLKRGGPGVVVTIEVADDDACAFLGPGQQITVWNGSVIGHGFISRRVFFTWAA